LHILFVVTCYSATISNKANNRKTTGIVAAVREIAYICGKNMDFEKLL
jgi:hypothetical protein